MPTTIKRIVGELREELARINSALAILQSLLEENTETNAYAQNHK